LEVTSATNKRHPLSNTFDIFLSFLLRPLFFSNKKKLKKITNITNYNVGLKDVNIYELFDMQDWYCIRTLELPY